MILAAFDLLRAPSGPVLADFPERIPDETGAPLACLLPPRMNASEPAAVDEARGLRAAYERNRAATHRTSVGKIVDADGIPAVVAAFVRIAEGTPVDDAGLPSDPHQAALDVRAYYEEAALALAAHVPGARAAESWFFGATQTGRVLREAQKRLVEAGRTDYFATIVPKGQE